MPPLPPMLRPGQSPTATEWNALVAQLRDALSTLSTAPGARGTGVGVTGGSRGGFQVLDGRTPGHWAKIGAGSGAAYAHTQAIPSGASGFRDLPASSETIWGTTSKLPARERHGSAAVPSGAYVWVDYDPVGNCFLFEYDVTGSGSGSGDAGCVEWYSIYLHMQVASVGVGEIVGPRQQIGQIGPYVGDLPHAHVAIGDGIPLAAPNGFPIAGQSIDIATWPGLPIVGSHTGIPPSGAARFSPEQVATIQAHFGLPVDESLPWTIGIGSEAHDLWDYYAIDLVLLDNPDFAIGQPVYAAFTGLDVRTTCVYAENLGENYQWIVILKHQIGDCSPCPPSRVVCQDGYLRRERCGPDGQWKFEEDLGVACNPKRTTPPGSGSGSGSGGGGSGPTERATVNFEVVSHVCTHRAGVTIVGESATLTGDETVVHVDAAAGPITVTLLDPAEIASPPASVMIKKIDASGNAVTINSVGGDVEFGSSLTLSAQGDWKPLYTDGTDWFVGTAAAVAAITVETRHVQVRAPGYVSDVVCRSDPSGCCVERDGGLGCCPDGSRDVLNGTASGPIGIGGAEIEFLMVLTREDGSWAGYGWLGVASGSDSPGDAVMDGQLYCTTDENGELVWQLAGSVTNGDGTTAQYRIDLTDEGDGYLVGVITFPADNEPVPVVIEHPCQSGPCCPLTVTTPLEFTAGGPVGPSGAAVTFEGSLEHVDGTTWSTGTPQTGNYPGTSITVELECDGGWKATGVITPAEGDPINYVVWLEDQGPKLHGEINLPGTDDVFQLDILTPCDEGSGGETRYNCVGGQCVEAEGGLFASLAECAAECGTVSTACCPDASLPPTVWARFSGGTGSMAALNGVVAPITWGGIYWSNFAVPVPGRQNAGVQMQCGFVTPGLWAITGSYDDGLGGSGQTYFGQQASATCEPFLVTRTVTSSDGATAVVEISETPP